MHNLISRTPDLHRELRVSSSRVSSEFLVPELEGFRAASEFRLRTGWSGGNNRLFFGFGGAPDAAEGPEHPAN